MHGVEKVFSWHPFRPYISVIYRPMWLRPLLNQGLRLQSAPRYQRLCLERFTGWPSAKQFSVLWGERISLAVTQVSELQLTEFSALLISHSAELDLQQHSKRAGSFWKAFAKEVWMNPGCTRSWFPFTRSSHSVLHCSCQGPGVGIPFRNDVQESEKYSGVKCVAKR